MAKIPDLVDLQSIARDLIAAARKAYPMAGDQAVTAVCRAAVEVELIDDPEALDDA